jgi:hypothetical protein
MPPPAFRHDALLNAVWQHYGHLAARPGEPASSWAARLRAAVDPRDPDVPEVVRAAVEVLLQLHSARVMAEVTGVGIEPLLKEPVERN